MYFSRPRDQRIDAIVQDGPKMEARKSYDFILRSKDSTQTHNSIPDSLMISGENLRDILS